MKPIREPRFKASLKELRDWVDDVEAKAILRAKMGELDDWCQLLITNKRELLLSDVPQWFKDTGCEVIDLKIAGKRKEILAMAYKIDIIDGRVPDRPQRLLDLEKIKEIPIADIMPCEPVQRAINRLYYKAPWRNETQASVVVYVDQNSFCDYGDNKTGSVIDMYMLINEVDFKTAIKELNINL